MKNVVTAFAILLLTALTGWADVPGSETLLAQAKAKAVAEHKTIFVHFGASWCIWCKRLDAWLDRSEVQPVINKYFVPIKLVVKEHAANKALENSGSEAVLQKLGGPSGLPFFAFLDAQGELIVNSKRDGTANIGYPSEPKEIEWFLKMLKKSAPAITEADLKILETSLAKKP